MPRGMPDWSGQLKQAEWMQRSRSIGNTTTMKSNAKLDRSGTKYRCRNSSAFGCAVALLLATTSTAALAGEEVVYEAAPDWIDPVDLANVERDPSNSLVVQDKQIRIEDGRLWEYTDTVYRLSSLQELGQVGTLTAQWLPDKGDLIVHEIAILRD